ncbi:hypothetical protein V8C40DRAFT_235364 [Trichoderma camerunense]
MSHPILRANSVTWTPHRLSSPKADQGREAARSTSPTNDGASSPPVTALCSQQGQNTAISHFPALNARIDMSDEPRHVGCGIHGNLSLGARTQTSEAHVSDRKRSCNGAKQDEKTQNKISVARGSQISGIKVPPARRRVRSPSGFTFNCRPLTNYPSRGSRKSHWMVCELAAMSTS